MSHVHLVGFTERKFNESTEQWILNGWNVRERMREQHKIVNSTSDKVEYRMVESRIIGTVFYFDYGNFVLGICKKRSILRWGLSTAIQ